MKLYKTGVRTSHLSNFLSFDHRLSFLHEELAVMCVSTEIGIVMLDNDQFAVTAQTLAAIHYFPSCRRGYRLPYHPDDIDAVGAFREEVGYFAFGGPYPFAMGIISNSYSRGNGNRADFRGCIFFDGRRGLYHRYRKSCIRPAFQLH